MSCIADNVVAFARLLRRAGLPVGPADMLAAQRALCLVNIGDRGEVRAGLRATMVHRHEQADIFDQAFSLFWRDPSGAGLGAPQDDDAASERPAPGARRLAEAMARHTPPQQKPDEPPKIDAVLTVSDTEKLQTMDFEAMSAEEIAAAKAAIKRLTLPMKDVRTRRWRPDASGMAVDLRATLRASLRQGGEIVRLARATRVSRPPPLVVLVDISGSMSRYAQILLHFVHAVANDRDRVSVFLFGTRLTNISRALRDRDPEVAFQMVTQIVPDWSGGTRIGDTLEAFNRNWARRVLGQGAVVLLVTDGLDREGARGLDAAMDRLHRSCRRLIWLNPLLRWHGFEPKSQGVRAMLPHVDEFRPVHDLASLRSLVESLSRPATRRST